MARGNKQAPGASKDVLIAESENLSSAEMLALAGTTNFVVREAIAGRADCPMGILISLAHDSKAVVRESVAANMVISPVVAEQLAKDRNAHVLLALLRNPVVPKEIVQRLGFHRNKEVASLACAVLDDRAPERVSISIDPGVPTRTAPVRGFKLTESDDDAEAGPRGPVEREILTRTAPVRGFKPPAPEVADEARPAAVAMQPFEARRMAEEFEPVFEPAHMLSNATENE